MRKSLLSGVAESARQTPPTEASIVDSIEKPSGPEPKLKVSPRAGLKHFGAYLDDDAVEKVAILRARLKLDNSQLVKLAIEELFMRQRAEGAFKG